MKKKFLLLTSFVIIAGTGVLFAFNNSSKSESCCTKQASCCTDSSCDTDCSCGSECEGTNCECGCECCE